MELYKIFIEVVLYVDSNGKKTPLFIICEGVKYDVKKVYGVYRAESQLGGIGTKYVCSIGGRVRNIFQLGSKKWFLEGFKGELSEYNSITCSPNSNKYNKRVDRTLITFSKEIKKTSNGVYYFRKYQPKVINNQVSKNYNEFSLNLARLFINKKGAIPYFNKQIARNLFFQNEDTRIAIICLPNYESDGWSKLSQIITDFSKKKGITSAAKCLKRTTYVNEDAWKYDKLSFKECKLTYEIVDGSLLTGKDVILFAEYTSSGNALLAAKSVLEENGYDIGNIYCVAFGH